MVMSAMGENKEKFCEFDLERKNRLTENPVLRMDDILANGWLVEG